MRLIDADALIEKIHDIYDGWIRSECISPFDMIEMIGDMSTIDHDDQRWIPVGERLPEEGQLVRICGIDDMEAVYEPSRNQFYPWHLTDQDGMFFTGGQFATHWMPKED